MKLLFSRIPQDDTLDRSIGPGGKGNKTKPTYEIIEAAANTTIVTHYKQSMGIEPTRKLDKITIHEFSIYVKKLLGKEILDADIKDVFYYLNTKAGAKATLVSGVMNILIGPGSIKAPNIEKSTISLADLSSEYLLWLKNETNVKGVLNTQNMKAKNIEIQNKLKYLAEYYENKQRIGDRQKQREEAVFRQFREARTRFEGETETIDECTDNFKQIIGEKQRLKKVQIILSRFMSSLSLPSGIIDIDGLKRHLDHMISLKNSDIATIERLFLCIKTDFLYQKNGKDSFSIFDMPALFNKNRFSEQDYQLCVRFLNKLKKRYFAVKVLESGADIKNLHLTEEDLFGLELFTSQVSHMKFKRDIEKSTMGRKITEWRTEINEKLRRLVVTNQRNIQKISNNILANSLSATLDKEFSEINFLLWKIRCIGVELKSTFLVRSSKELAARYFIMANKTAKDKDFAGKNAIKLNEFNGQLRYVPKKPDNLQKDGSLNKDMADLFETEESLKESGGRKKESIDQVKVEEDIEEWAAALNPVLKDPGQSMKIPKGDKKVQFAAEIQKEEFEDEDFSKIIEEKKEIAYESPRKELFRSSQGNLFNPAQQFGMIDKNYITYDPRTSAYPSILPPEFYENYIHESSPARSKKWFVRPHHVETLTSNYIYTYIYIYIYRTPIFNWG